MSGFLVIADEATCAGFRLTGAQTRTPAAEETAAAFAEAMAAADVVIVTAEIARRLPQETLSAALLVETPAVVVIPDLRERVAPPSLGARIRRTLGIEA